MAVINDPNIAGQVEQVGMGAGTVWTPGHQAAGPLSIGTGGAYRLSLSSGTMAASLAAAAEIFQFRFVTAASRTCLVHRIRVSASILTLPAISITVLPGGLGLNACVARAWSAAGSGGTRGVLTGNNAKLRTSHQTSEVNDTGIATTAALTVGTKTLDTANFGGVMGNSPGVLTAVGAAGPSFIPSTDLLGDMGLSFPLVLVNNEGFIIRNSILAFPATMTWSFTVDVAWSEVQSF
jgi:hypothetical protein